MAKKPKMLTNRNWLENFIFHFFLWDKTSPQKLERPIKQIALKISPGIESKPNFIVS